MINYGDRVSTQPCNKDQDDDYSDISDIRTETKNDNSLHPLVIYAKLLFNMIGANSFFKL